MKLVEHVKIISASTTSKLEKKFNEWVIEQRKMFDSHTILLNTPFTIVQRELTIRVYEGEETFALAVFYNHPILTPKEQGNVDKARGGNATSAFKQQRAVR